MFSEFYANSTAQTGHLLEGYEDAEPVGAGELVQVAGAVGAVLQLVCGVCAVPLPVADEALGEAAGRAGAPGGRAGELLRRARPQTCRE